MSTLYEKANAILTEKEEKIKANNIRRNINVFDVTGNLDDLAITEDATAVANDIKKGKTAYVNKQKIIGTFEELDTSDATAVASDIMFPKSAYINGERIVGSIQSEYEDTPRIYELY